MLFTAPSEHTHKDQFAKLIAEVRNRKILQQQPLGGQSPRTPVRKKGKEHSEVVAGLVGGDKGTILTRVGGGVAGDTDKVLVVDSSDSGEEEPPVPIHTDVVPERYCYYM